MAEESKRKTRQLAVDIEFRQLDSERQYELQRLQSENKNRHESELSQRESETQIRIAELTSASNTNVSTNQNNSNPSCRQIRDLPPLRSLDRDQIENYLNHFEKLCQLNEISRDKYCSYIASKLPSELIQIMTRVPVEHAHNYDLFRENVSHKYLLNSDYYRMKFYALNLETGDSNTEFVRKLEQLLDRWLKSEQVKENYQDLFNFLILQQFLRRQPVDKLLFIRERDEKDLQQIASLADIYDKAHLRDPAKKKVYNFNSYGSQNNSSNMVHANPQNTDKVGCTNCGRKNHTAETCFSKKNQTQDKGVITCTHCKKNGHNVDSCYALHGRPTLQKNKSGPQPSSTFKHKSPHQAAAVQICESPSSYMVFENSKLNKHDLNEEDMQYSLLESAHEDVDQIFTSCTIMDTYAKGLDDQILNPYSMAQIEGSDELQMVLRDSGSFISIIKKDLVPWKCYTNRVVSLQFADGSMTTVPTALMKINSECFTGKMEFAVLPNPVSPIIIGNMKHVTENFSNRRIGNDSSQRTIQQKIGKSHECTQTQNIGFSPVANQQKMLKSETVLEQKKFTNEINNRSVDKKTIPENNRIEISPVAEQQKMFKPKQIVVEQKHITNKMNNRTVDKNIQEYTVHENVRTLISPGAEQHKRLNSEQKTIEHEQIGIELDNKLVHEIEQKYRIYENKMLNSTNVSIEPEGNLVSTEHINKTNMIMEEESNMVDCSSFMDSPASGNKINSELTTLIDCMDQSKIPINAIMTRSKARQLSDIKMPDMLLQIPDISPERFREMQKTDKGLEKYWKLANSKVTQEEDLKANFIIKKGLLYRKPVRPKGLGESTDTQLVIPSELRHIVLRTAHESVLGAHMGTKKTTQRIQVNFWFDGIVSYTHRYCKSCDVCQRTIKHGKISKAPMLISKLSDSPFSRISCDLVGPIIPSSQSGYTYILTIIDLATRYPDAIPLKRITTGKVAEALKDFFFRMGIPDVISTDNGPQFCSNEMEDFFKLFKIKHIRSTPYHPMAMGCVENLNGSLKKCLLRLCAENTKQWDTFIGPCLYALRETVHSSTGFSPNECVFGRTLKSSGDILRQLLTDDQVVPEIRTTYQHVLDLRSKIQETCELVKKRTSQFSTTE